MDDGRKTEDIFIDDDYLFENLHEQEIKDISNDMTNALTMTRTKYCLKIYQSQNL